MFGMSIRYFPNNWPQAHGPPLTDDEADRLEVPDLERNELFPQARRNLLVTSMDLKNKSWDEIRVDLDRIAAELGPCDLGDARHRRRRARRARPGRARHLPRTER